MEGSAYSTILYAKKGRVARVVLDRPEVHNAFNSLMIGELLSVFDQIKSDTEVRVAVLTGQGKSFCAGADLNWMREITQYSYEQNLAESLQIAELHQNIYMLPKPTVAMVNGTAIGRHRGRLRRGQVRIE
jgi:methylglutaconyl-CoA hydratase